MIDRIHVERSLIELSIDVVVPAMRSSNIQVGPWTKSPNNFSLMIQITERDKQSQMVQSSLNQAAAHIDLHCWSHRLEPDSQFLELISKVEEKEEIQDDQTVDLNGMGLPIAKGLGTKLLVGFS